MSTFVVIVAGFLATPFLLLAVGYLFIKFLDSLFAPSMSAKLKLTRLEDEFDMSALYRPQSNVSRARDPDLAQRERVLERLSAETDLIRKEAGIRMRAKRARILVELSKDSTDESGDQDTTPSRAHPVMHDVTPTGRHRIIHQKTS